MTAQQVHEELQRAGSDVGLTTVYRALHLLAGAGLVHVFDHRGEASYRRCGTESHHHLVCRICGLVIENVDHTAIEQWLDQIPPGLEFSPEWHRLEVYGVCGNCLPQEASRPAPSPSVP